MSAIIPTAERGAAVCGAPAEENSFAAAEYFAGIGLFRMGLEATGWNPPSASHPDAGERDANKRQAAQAAIDLLGRSLGIGDG